MAVIVVIGDFQGVIGLFEQAEFGIVWRRGRVFGADG